ncbi:hypothetical protein TREES_T100017306 [Tupaia chinensis]|uniref:Uncharacterized protein n=1 Tax=Tupaia chinensis TaxID=246437 RepID=L9JB61_TUPCH|nr:hypothetical protein TREES_T100017306 [Tupaia chinensis]
MRAVKTAWSGGRVLVRLARGVNSEGGSKKGPEDRADALCSPSVLPQCAPPADAGFGGQPPRQERSGRGADALRRSEGTRATGRSIVPGLKLGSCLHSELPATSCSTCPSLGA